MHTEKSMSDEEFGFFSMRTNFVTWKTAILKEIMKIKKQQVFSSNQYFLC